ncbi:protoglobin domain-containing protein [Saccharomonospora iraqiensis]|uniref:protoglobin domain-containing protein n=1 Tax=Saccharomonospora iraqiensis TaxID=52698 RepID=UPI00040E65B3|nr:protoglobin domain-containing protein [Saccharomonospora iraqiensis]
MATQQKTIDIAGYDYGHTATRSPMTEEDLDHLLQTVMFTDDDRAALRTAGDVLEDQTDKVLDVWYGFVADHPHLMTYFSTPGGEPIQRYLDRVRPRFKQWILDTCRRPFDRAWLDYQEEIALRHTVDKKNVTDGVDSTTPIPLRYMVAFIYPITATMRDFLAAKGHSAEQVEKMQQAWFKAVTLQMALWSRPYARENHA